MTDDLSIYRRANLYLQIFLAVGLAIFIAGAMHLFPFDYAFYGGVICVAIGAGVRQIIVSRNS